MEKNNRKEEAEKRETKKSIRDNLIFPLIVAIVSILLTYHFTAESVQKGVVETLSMKLDYIEATDKIEEAIDEISKKDKELKEYERKSEELQSKVSSAQNASQVEYHTIAIFKDGQKTEDGIKNGWAIIDGKNFYSENTMNSLLGHNVYLDEVNSTLSFNSDGSNNYKETKVALEKTDVLRPGKRCTVFDGTSSDTFSMGSSTYNTGFSLKSDGWYYEGTALFDLSEKYSKISFDVGNINGDSQGDAVLRIYFRKATNDKMTFEQEFELQGDVSSKHVEINLNHYCDMTIELNHIDEGVEYGFANLVLEY